MDENSDPTKSSRDEALAWFTRLNSGDATDDDRARFGAWLRAGAANRAAYEELEDLWADLDHVPDPRRHVPARPAMMSRRRVLAGAAGMAAATGLVVASGITLDDVEGIIAADYRTGTGERRSVTLADGTGVDLDAATAIAEEFDGRVRRVRLMQGRAVFNVAADPSRPFDVVCAQGTVRAAGTRFAVHKRPNDTAVAVIESAVDVCIGTPGAGGENATLKAGQRITYGPLGLGRVVSAADGAETAWQHGRMVFRERPLGDVIADLNRYRPGRIVIWDEALNGLRVDGVFNLEKPEAALHAIVSTLSVRETRLTPYLVLIAAA